MAAEHHISLDVDVPKMLFDAMMRKPVAEFVEDLEGVKDRINVKNSSGRTMLHQAVYLGKVDWVREILRVGADHTAMEEDGDGRTALQVAMEMLSKYPEEKERKTVLDMLVQSSVECQQRKSKCPVNISASIGMDGLVDSKLEDIIKKVFSNEIATFKESTTETLNIISTQLNALKQSDEEMKGELRSMMESLEEMKGEVNAVKQSHGDMKVELISMKQSREEMRDELATTVHDLETRIQNACIKKDATSPMLVSAPDEAVREHTIDAMMQRTKVKPSNEEEELKMRKWYERMYDRDPILSKIQQFLRFQRVEVHVDFESHRIGGMKPTIRDHDGEERDGDKILAFADFEERKVYVGGKGSDEVSKLPLLTHALCQLSVFLAFGNKGLPYLEEGDGVRGSVFKGILEEVERKKRDGEELDGWIRMALHEKTPMVREMNLLAAVPDIVAYNGSLEGRSILNKQIPSLLEYFDGHVVETLRRETMEAAKRGALLQ